MIYVNKKMSDYDISKLQVQYPQSYTLKDSRIIKDNNKRTDRYSDRYYVIDPYALETKHILKNLNGNSIHTITGVLKIKVYFPTSGELVERYKDKRRIIRDNIGFSIFGPMCPESKVTYNEYKQGINLDIPYITYTKDIYIHLASLDSYPYDRIGSRSQMHANVDIVYAAMGDRLKQTKNDILIHTCESRGCQSPVLLRIKDDEITDTFEPFQIGGYISSIYNMIKDNESYIKYDSSLVASSKDIIAALAKSGKNVILKDIKEDIFLSEIYNANK